MDDSWPGPLTDTVRTSLADHGAEMLPGQVEAWLRWIPDHVCTEPGGLGWEDPDEDPFDEFLPHDWCHMILLAHRLVPDGPDRMRDPMADDVISELERWYIVEGPNAIELLPLVDDDDEDMDNADAEGESEAVIVVLPLAVFAKGLAMLATASASSNTLISAHLESTSGAPQISLLEVAESDERPEINEYMAVDMVIGQFVMVASAAVTNVRDTAGDIEVMDELVVRMASLLQKFAGLEFVQELAEVPREPTFLGTIGSLADECFEVSAALLDALEMADLA